MPALPARTARTASRPLPRRGQARQISAELGSVLLDTLGLAATIEWHVGQFRKCTGVPYELTVNDEAGFDLPEDCAARVFGTYSETLGKVARHARSRVAIALTITPREVSMVMRDSSRNAGTAVKINLPIAS